MATFTQEEIAEVKAKILSLIATAKTGDDLVTYQALADQLKLLEIMQADVNGAANRRTLSVYSPGFQR